MAIQLVGDDGLDGSLYPLTTAKYTIDVDPLFLPYTLQHEPAVLTAAPKTPLPVRPGVSPLSMIASSLCDVYPTAVTHCLMTSRRLLLLTTAKYTMDVDHFFSHMLFSTRLTWPPPVPGNCPATAHRLMTSGPML